MNVFAPSAWSFSNVQKHALLFPTQHTQPWCSALEQKPQTWTEQSLLKETHIYNVVFELDVKAVTRQGDDNLLRLFHILHTFTVQHRERDLHRHNQRLKQKDEQVCAFLYAIPQEWSCLQMFLFHIWTPSLWTGLLLFTLKHTRQVLFPLRSSLINTDSRCIRKYTLTMAPVREEGSG